MFVKVAVTENNANEQLKESFGSWIDVEPSDKLLGVVKDSGQGNRTPEDVLLRELSVWNGKREPWSN